MNDEIDYLCGNCGEQIVIPWDYSQGSQQEFVEDCPVCCHPNLIRVTVDQDGRVDCWSELE